MAIRKAGSKKGTAVFSRRKSGSSTAAAKKGSSVWGAPVERTLIDEGGQFPIYRRLPKREFMSVPKRGFMITSPEESEYENLVKKITQALRGEGLERDSSDIRQLAREATTAISTLAKLAPSTLSPGKRAPPAKAQTVPVMDAAVESTRISKRDVQRAIRVTQNVFSK